MAVVLRNNYPGLPLGKLLLSLPGELSLVLPEELSPKLLRWLSLKPTSKPALEIAFTVGSLLLELGRIPLGEGIFWSPTSDRNRITVSLYRRI